jgi:flagellar motor switch/type III secretory pathway protein FliN
MTETELTVQIAATPAAREKENPEIPSMANIEDHPAWPTLSRLPVTMTAQISLSRFKVRNLLGLTPGQVFESDSPDTEDVPLLAGGVQLGWTEFEVVEQKIAIRLTRLA